MAIARVAQLEARWRPPRDRSRPLKAQSELQEAKSRRPGRPSTRRSPMSGKTAGVARQERCSEPAPLPPSRGKTANARAALTRNSLRNRAQSTAAARQLPSSPPSRTAEGQRPPQMAASRLPGIHTRYRAIRTRTAVTAASNQTGPVRGDRRDRLPRLIHFADVWW